MLRPSGTAADDANEKTHRASIDGPRSAKRPRKSRAGKARIYVCITYVRVYIFAMIRKAIRTVQATVLKPGRELLKNLGEAMTLAHTNAIIKPKIKW